MSGAADADSCNRSSNWRLRPWIRNRMAALSRGPPRSCATRAQSNFTSSVDRTLSSVGTNSTNLSTTGGSLTLNDENVAHGPQQRTANGERPSRGSWSARKTKSLYVPPGQCVARSLAAPFACGSALAVRRVGAGHSCGVLDRTPPTQKQIQRYGTVGRCDGRNRSSRFAAGKCGRHGAARPEAGLKQLPAGSPITLEAGHVCPRRRTEI